MATLFDSLKLGDITLSNRIIMAPMTRMRSKQPGNIPYALNAEYYAQRASAGLIISEATQISQQGQGYPCTPGIHTADQVEGWKLVTDAIHAKGGKIFLQLWHVGRISHSSYQTDGLPPVAPSSIKPTGKAFTIDWNQVDFEVPHALEISEIKEILNDYQQACERAMLAGFDGVEVHGANGYLLDQFLQDGSNKRDDIYGSSIENRARFLLEVVDIAAKVWGNSRVGVRLSPYGTFNDMSDSDPLALFTYVLKELDRRKIAYVHMIEPRATAAGNGDTIIQNVPSTLDLFPNIFNGVFISAGGYSPESAKATVMSGQANAIAFGRFYISNPDLVERIWSGVTLTPYHRATFYGGAEKGYTDYLFFCKEHE
ncbi:MAG: alkene reductase [Caedibacter sp. 37-49]|nr:MAG: alkene reductase [Caedibacter sp. 37-49]